ncbi:hypothetical protein Nham_1539 [Nitrobacter hamburgensis X14]|uniref:Uncharacterized protein n=1 Tax=Nitrobacter hamburgensis (strain DSM 10229 / NCIMB 13809 / X14) TaxID=323097 RepID=Q1QN36_NITHX|nr:hypothetical protein Nham_1539 [Nitrobacter hamburgensis X14]
MLAQRVRRTPDIPQNNGLFAIPATLTRCARPARQRRRPQDQADRWTTEFRLLMYAPDRLRRWAPNRYPRPMAFSSEARPRGWIPVRVKKTRQNKKLEPGFDSIRSGAPVWRRLLPMHEGYGTVRAGRWSVSRLEGNISIIRHGGRRRRWMPRVTDGRKRQPTSDSYAVRMAPDQRLILANREPPRAAIIARASGPSHAPIAAEFPRRNEIARYHARAVAAQRCYWIGSSVAASSVIESEKVRLRTHRVQTIRLTSLGMVNAFRKSEGTGLERVKARKMRQIA